MSTYSNARRAKNSKEINKKKIAICLILLILIVAVVYFIIANNLFGTNNNVVEGTEELSETVVEEAEETVEDEMVDTDEIPEKMGNYKVDGELVIDKIDVKKNILSVCNDESLGISAAKLYGPDLNTAGNYCISGHNWKSMLKRLSEMEVGDTFYTVNRETGTKVNYEIYNIYSCDPKDISCLDQNKNGKREITLITCNPGAVTRLILKARETKKV